MAEDYRSLPQWQALNRIWKAVPQSAREGVKEDFRVITELIKGMGGEKPAETPAAAPTPAAKRDFTQDDNYLSGLSAPARKLALNALTKRGYNLYAGLMELIESAKAETAEELWDAYVSQTDAEEEDEAALREIMEACLRKYRT